MPEIDLTFIGVQLERVLAELRDVRAANARIEHELHEQRQDIGSLGRVMLRFESRLHDLEQTN